MILELLEKLKKDAGEIKTNSLVNCQLNTELETLLYPKSVNKVDNSYFFIGKDDKSKYLFIVEEHSELKLHDRFDGEIVTSSDTSIFIKRCRLIHENAVELQKLFPYTKPILIGLQNSFGFGDRLGTGNPAHIRSLGDSKFKPIIAQQSIRELTRTNRTPEEVMDAAIWSVFQEGYKNGFGADADHLKSTEDIDLMINAGFTMFTFDPSEHVINEADSLGLIEIENRVNDLNWKTLNDSLTNVVNRYTSVKFELGRDFTIVPTYEEVLRAILKYGNAIAHLKILFAHLNSNYSDLPFEIEISVDETDSVTTPFEHLFMTSELTRLGIKFVSLAPRFVGSFEKGIDYKGDIDVFKKEYLKHVQISEHFGSYKISLHSGSDKFEVYKAIGQLNRGYTHVKTAGTSYLEALRVTAKVKPDLFREILDFSRNEFEKEKKSYHISADLENVPTSENYSNDQLIDLFNQNDARQVLHVTFGKVLKTLDNNGKFLFKDKIYNCLSENEEIHYNYLISHFNNHLNPFN